MAEAERSGAVILGSDEGGEYLAWHLAHAGQPVGVPIGPFVVDLEQVRKRKRDMSSPSR
jgi:hypothetical protein